MAASKPTSPIVPVSDITSRMTLCAWVAPDFPPDFWKESFIKMSKESAYHEMSYLEKKRKDKEFGKMVKTVMKDKKK